MSFWSPKAPVYTKPAKVITQQELQNETWDALKLYPETNDAAFSDVPYAWLFDKTTQKELRNYFWSNLPEYASEAFDCENFAVELNQWICRKAGFARLTSCPRSAVLCVKNTIPWAGVRDGNHALNYIKTDKGAFVIEPQTIRRFAVYARYQDYPNKPYRLYF
jgi:hypothetical protein